VEVFGHTVLTTLAPPLIPNVLFVDFVNSSSDRAHWVRVDAAGSHDSCLSYDLLSLRGRGFPRGTWENADFSRVRAKSLVIFLDNSFTEYWTSLFNDLDNRDCNVSDRLVLSHNNLVVDFLTALCLGCGIKITLPSRAIGNRLRLGVPDLSVLIVRSTGFIVHDIPILRISDSLRARGASCTWSVRSSDYSACSCSC